MYLPIVLRTFSFSLQLLCLKKLNKKINYQRVELHLIFKRPDVSAALN